MATTPRSRHVIIVCIWKHVCGHDKAVMMTVIVVVVFWFFHGLFLSGSGGCPGQAFLEMEEEELSSGRGEELSSCFVCLHQHAFCPFGTSLDPTCFYLCLSTNTPSLLLPYLCLALYHAFLETSYLCFCCHRSLHTALACASYLLVPHYRQDRLYCFLSSFLTTTCTPLPTTHTPFATLCLLYAHYHLPLAHHLPHTIPSLLPST